MRTLVSEPQAAHAATRGLLVLTAPSPPRQLPAPVPVTVPWGLPPQTAAAPVSSRHAGDNAAGEPQADPTGSPKP
jgi:hypothetical protein